MQRNDDSLARFLVGRLEQTGAKVTRPTVSLLNGFKYTPSHATDIRQTFDRARQAQEATQ